jgi:hypothetical protein
LENKGKKEVYLIDTGEVSPSYMPNEEKLYMSLEKISFAEHFFEMPKIVKLKSREIYSGKANLRPGELENWFSLGSKYIYLSIGYLDNQGMNEINELLKRYKQPRLVAPEFLQQQKLIIAGPIKIKLVE